MKTNIQFFNNADPHLKIRLGPAGILFFNRITGINVLVDEIIPPKNVWATAPRQVSIALTNQCDLNCPHCYAPKYPGMNDYNNVIKWLSDLDANGCIGVGFGGGEPTLYPQLAELCSYTVNKTKLAVIMTTHAHRLTEHVLDKLEGNVHFVRVSMDGIGQTYESIRSRPFNVLLRRITAIRRISDFGINFIVNAKTIKDIDTAVNLAEDLGAREFLLIPEVPAGRGKGIDKDTTGKLHKWVTQYRGTVPLTVSEGGADGLPVCNPFNNESGLTSYAHIDANGVIKRTSYDISGVSIQEDGIMAALDRLKAVGQEAK